MCKSLSAYSVGQMLMHMSKREISSPEQQRLEQMLQHKQQLHALPQYELHFNSGESSDAQTLHKVFADVSISSVASDNLTSSGFGQSSTWTSMTLTALATSGGHQDPLMFWTLTLIASVCMWVLSAHAYGFQMMRIGLHTRVGCSYLIYRKSLRLGQHESSQKTMGRMVSLRDAYVAYCLLSIVFESERARDVRARTHTR